MKTCLPVAAVLLALGCSTPKAQTFAVTLLDSTTLDCAAYPVGLLSDPVMLQNIAKAQGKAWQDAYVSSPPRPEARILRINELETRMQAWFDPSPADSGRADSGIAGVGGGLSAEIVSGGTPTFAYDAPTTVYQGELHNDYVEGLYADSLDSDPEDQDAGRYACGPRTSAQGMLTVTKVNGVQGRIRWTDVTWVGSEFAVCEGHVDCVRNIAVEGLSVE